jgi:O-antigen/teichoic acid export membrane protein
MALNRMGVSMRLRAFDAVLPRGLRGDVASAFSVQVISFLLSLMMASITARWLGPEGKGTLSLVLLGSGLLALLLGGGVNVANVYFAASGRVPISQLTGFSLSWTLLATAAALVVIAAFSIWSDRVMPGFPQWGPWAMLCFVPWMVLGNNFSAVLQGLRRIPIVSKIRLAQSTLTLLLTVSMVAGLRWGLIGTLAAVLVSQVIGAGLMSRALHRQGGRLRPDWPDSARAVTAFGIKGNIANLLQFLNYRLDIFVVNYFLGPAAVGIYGVAVSLAELLWFLPDAVGYAVFPRAAAAKGDAHTWGWRYAAMTTGVTAAGAAVLAVSAPVVIRGVFSPTFIGAYPALLWLLPGAVLLSGAKVLANEIVGRGYPQYNAITAAIALGVTIVLDLLLIPRLGIAGAAMATSLSYATVLAAVVYFSVMLGRRRVTSPAAQVEAL